MRYQDDGSFDDGGGRSEYVHDDDLDMEYVLEEEDDRLMDDYVDDEEDNNNDNISHDANDADDSGAFNDEYAWNILRRRRGTGKSGGSRNSVVGWSRRGEEERRQGRLYWVDLELKRIEVADFDGGNRHVIVMDMGEGLPTGLALIGGWLLWATNQSVVERVDKKVGGGREVFWRGQHPVLLMSSTSWAKSGAGERCPEDWCSHFCMREEEEEEEEDGLGELWRCSCPLGMQLEEDARRCRQPNSCSSHQFTCVSNGFCIDLSWRCDNHPDCPDKSDEEGCGNCTKGRCGRRKEASCEGAFECKQGGCVDRRLLCDSKVDCADGSDEETCASSKTDDFSAASYVVGLGLTAVVVVVGSALILLIFVCRRKSRKLTTASADDVVMVANATSPSFSIPDSNMQLLRHSDYGEACHCSSQQESSFVGVPDGSSCYDRGRLTGASSTTGSVLARPLFDPPPSLITEPHEDLYSGDNSTHECRKKRRRRHKPQASSMASTSTEEMIYNLAPPPPSPYSGAMVGGASVDGSDVTSFLHPSYPPAPPSSFHCLTEEEEEEEDEGEDEEKGEKEEEEENADD